MSEILRYDGGNKKSAVKNFIKKNVVLCLAVIVAVITAFFVPPDSEYLNYFDLKTLTCLFCVLAVVCALKNIKFFYILACLIVKVFKNTRTCVLAIVYITFIGSMLIANDMALLTFLPLSFYVLYKTENKNLIAFTFIMQTIGANLGGMLTPFGNPQNLYLYTKFQIPTVEFLGVMLAPFLVSLALITLCCLFVKKQPVEIKDDKQKLPPLKTVVYLILFAYSLIIVFRVIPYWTGLIVIPVVIFIFDRKALLQVDYSLLFTFVAFFVFSGNMSRIPVVQEFFGYLMNKSPLLVSVLCCQVISNVPSSILLSQFTSNYVPLLIGVNIGGCGTLISSLASLITFKEYSKDNPGYIKKYLLLFTAFNFGFLILLTVLSLLFFV